MPTVFVDGRCADHLDLTTRQCRLQNVRGIHSTLRAAGADDGVDFVDEEDDVGIPAHLVHDVFHPLLKFAAVLCARDHGGQIQCDDHLVAQRIRYHAVYDPLCQSLHNGGFANPWLADQTWVVLCPAREDLDYPLCFRISADDGIDLALLRHFAEISAIGGEGCRVLEIVFRGFIAFIRFIAFVLSEIRHDIALHVSRGNALRLHQSDSEAFRLIADRAQKMLRADVAVAEIHGDSGGGFDDFFGSGCDVGSGQSGRFSGADVFNDPFARRCKGNAAPFQDRFRDALLFRQQSEQKMLAADAGVTHFTGIIKRAVQCVLCLFRESDLHMVAPFLRVVSSLFKYSIRAVLPVYTVSPEISRRLAVAEDLRGKITFLPC